MSDQTTQPDCPLTDLVAAAIGAAREAAIALDRITGIPTDAALVSRVQRVLSEDPPISEGDLETIRDLIEALNAARDAERSWFEPEGAAMAIEELTPRGKEIQEAARLLSHARAVAARAADRWRAERVIASGLQ